jgi:hypothetical protein
MHEDTTMIIASKEEEKPEPTERRKSLVTDWLARVKSAKGFHEKSFKQMKKDMDATLNGYDDTQWNDKNYVANILQRHVQQRTASLYAKNPKATAKRRERMDYAIWDGDEKTLAAAYEANSLAEQSGLMPPAEATSLIQDYTSGQTHRKMLYNVAKT